MTAFNKFIIASASYFGVPVDQITHGSTIDASTGDIEVVLRIALTEDDMAGITRRMTEMRKAEQEAESKQAQEGPAPGRSDAQTRSEWDSLSEVEKSRYGSFARFKAGAPLYAPEPVGVPEVVWVWGLELTEQQKVMAVGRDDKGRFGMDPADLTPEQIAKHFGVQP